MSTEQRAFQMEMLSTGDVAGWVGYSTQCVRHWINVGVTAPSGVTVKLEAATVSRSGRRRSYRVSRQAFVSFLKEIRWPHIPGQHATGHP
jgi:hypothetical protein